MIHVSCFMTDNMYLILRWLLNALGLLAIAYLVPGIFVERLYIALILVVVLGIVNALLGGLIKLLTLPLTILTLGLFSLVVNGLMFWFVSSFIKGFYVSGFWIAVLGALLYTLVTVLTGWLLKKEDWFLPHFSGLSRLPPSQKLRRTRKSGRNLDLWKKFYSTPAALHAAVMLLNS